MEYIGIIEIDRVHWTIVKTESNGFAFGTVVNSGPLIEGDGFDTLEELYNYLLTEWEEH